MFLNKHKVIGIMGGMGPDATVDLYNHIIRLTPADKDQDHIPVLIYSNPKIPDRTASIESGNTDEIIRYIQETARILEEGGADLISIPCNTVHQFYDDIVEAVSIPVLHLIRETIGHVKNNYLDEGTVGLIGTTGTMKTGLYRNPLEELGLDVISPDEEDQKNYIMNAIYAIKAGDELSKARDLLIEGIENLNLPGNKVVIMGCTEIPLAFKEPLEDVLLVNPTAILARASLNQCRVNIND